MRRRVVESMTMPPYHTITEERECFEAMRIFSQALPKMWCHDLVWNTIMEGRAHIVCRVNGHEVHLYAPDIAERFRCFISKTKDIDEEKEGWYVNFHGDESVSVGPMKLRGMRHPVSELLESNCVRQTIIHTQCVILSCCAV